MSEEKRDFVVKDRRIFSQESQEPDKKEDQAASTPPADQARQHDSQPASAADQQEAQPQLPQINFPTFIASLNASALLHLGMIEDPVTGKKTKNLPMAKQTIDILSMLEEKTSGNLTKEEEGILKNILYDLRIMYVKEKG